LATKAIETAVKKFEEWKWVDPAERSKYLLKAANLMRQRKHEFSAVMIYEVGKTWPEADADTAEAIDFLEFYAREILRYSAKQPITKISGETNELWYIPIGAGVIVPPWNFALAILTGMTSAAVVAGKYRSAQTLQRLSFNRMDVLQSDARGRAAGRCDQFCHRVRRFCR